MGHQCEMFIIDIRNVDTVLSQDDAISRIAVNGPKISAILWGALDETIITGHEDGEITLWDVRVSNVFFGCVNRDNVLNRSIAKIRFLRRRGRSCPA